MTSQIYDTAAVVLDLHCTGIIARMILLILRCTERLIIKDVSVTLLLSFFPKIVLHSLHNFVKSYCTLSNSYCTLCALKHTILGPGLNNQADYY